MVTCQSKIPGLSTWTTGKLLTVSVWHSLGVSIYLGILRGEITWNTDYLCSVCYKQLCTCQVVHSCSELLESMSHDMEIHSSPLQYSSSAGAGNCPHNTHWPSSNCSHTHHSHTNCTHTLRSHTLVMVGRFGGVESCQGKFVLYHVPCIVQYTYAFHWAHVILEKCSLYCIHTYVLYCTHI